MTPHSHSETSAHDPTRRANKQYLVDLLFIVQCPILFVLELFERDAEAVIVHQLVISLCNRPTDQLHVMLHLVEWPYDHELKFVLGKKKQ